MVTGTRPVAVKLGKTKGKKNLLFVQRTEDMEQIFFGPMSPMLAPVIGYFPVPTYPSPFSRRERQPLLSLLHVFRLNSCSEISLVFQCALP